MLLSPINFMLSKWLPETIVVRHTYKWALKSQATTDSLVYCVSVVVIHFLSGVVPLTEMAGFTPFLLQLLAHRPSTCLVPGHPPYSNQSSLSPLPLASSRSSSVVLTFSCHLLRDSEQPSKHYRHPSSAYVHTIQLHSLLLTGL